MVFGDYMQRPPAPERVAKHELLFVDMDHPYTDYKGVYYLKFIFSLNVSKQVYIKKLLIN